MRQSKQLLCYILVFSVLGGNFARAQEKGSQEKVSEEGYSISIEELREEVVRIISTVRRASVPDPLLQLDILNEVAGELASSSARGNKITREEEIKAMVVKAGGNPSAEISAILDNVTLKKGKAYLSREEVRAELEKKLTGKKLEKAIAAPQYVLLGVGTAIDEKGKGIICILTSTWDIDNRGAAQRKNLPVRWQKSTRGVKPYDKSACKDIGKFDDWNTLVSGLQVEGRYVKLYYPDLLRLSPLFDGKKDALAVEFVLHEQFPCNGINIVDRTHMWRGYTSRPVKAPAILKRNLAVGEMDAIVGKAPKKLTQAGSYEMNLIIIQDGHFCLRVIPGFIDSVSAEFKPEFELVPDTLVQKGEKRFTPTPEKRNLVFIVPFEKDKYEYKEEDIKPLIEALDVPDFTINAIYIEAHSSIEGDSARNAKLQIARAESIAKVLEKMQRRQLIKKITHDDSWKMFKEQIKNHPKWGWLVDTTKEFVREQFRKYPNLEKELDSLLRAQRFARVELDVTIDIKGGAELRYFQRKLHQAYQQGDVAQALAIQRFLISQVLAGKYNPDVLLNMEIPANPAYAVLHLNQLWVAYKFKFGGKLTGEVCDSLTALKRLLPQNPYILFNELVCKITSSDIEQAETEKLQEQVASLYSSPLPAQALDQLNLTLQIKIIEQLLSKGATTENHSLNTAWQKAKEIFKPEKFNEDLALKLITLALKLGDRPWAIQTIEHYISSGRTSPQMGHLYASLVSWDDTRVGSVLLRRAFLAWSQQNPSAICSKIRTPQGPSIQWLLDPFIKHVFCEECGGQ